MRLELDYTDEERVLWLNKTINLKARRQLRKSVKQLRKVEDRQPLFSVESPSRLEQDVSPKT